MKDFFYSLKFSFLILGAIIGAGLASGQEIVVFFTQYGFVSLLFLPLIFIAIYLGLKQTMGFGKICYTSDFLKNNKTMMFFDYLSLIFLTIIGSAMLAGANELCNSVIRKFNFPIYSLALIIISSIILIFGFKGILKLSVYIVPFIIFGIIFISIKTLLSSPLSAPSFSTDLPSIGLLIFSCVSYSCCNLATTNRVLYDCGNKLNNKQIKYVSYTVTSVLLLLIGTIILTILLSDNAILFLQLPLLYLAYLISKPVGLCFSLVMFLSILTTLFSTQYSFVNILNDKFKGNHVLKKKTKATQILFCALLFFLISLIGFNGIIKYFYSIIGAFGFVMIVWSMELSSKTSFNSANNKIHSASK